MGMSERHDNPAARAGWTTDEFRAAGDLSANTAQFRAFAESDEAVGERPWAVRAPTRSIGKLAVIAAAIVVLAAIIVYLLVVK